MSMSRWLLVVLVMVLAVGCAADLVGLDDEVGAVWVVVVPESIPDDIEVSYGDIQALDLETAEHIARQVAVDLGVELASEGYSVTIYRADDVLEWRVSSERGGIWARVVAVERG